MGERGGWTNRVTTGHTGGLTHTQFNPIICQLLLSVVLYGVLWVEVGIEVILFSGQLIVQQRGFREFTSNSTRFSNNQWVSMGIVLSFLRPGATMSIALRIWIVFL